MEKRKGPDYSVVVPENRTTTQKVGRNKRGGT